MGFPKGEATVLFVVHQPSFASPFGRLGSPRTIRKVLGRLLCYLSCRNKKGRPPAGTGTEIFKKSPTPNVHLSVIAIRKFKIRCTFGRDGKPVPYADKFQFSCAVKNRAAQGNKDFHPEGVRIVRRHCRLNSNLAHEKQPSLRGRASARGNPLRLRIKLGDRQEVNWPQAKRGHPGVRRLTPTRDDRNFLIVRCRRGSSRP